MKKINKNNKTDNEFQPAMRRGRIEQLTIYEISDNELETLSKGSPDSIYLIFAIFLLSIASSFAIALCTTIIKTDKLFVIFVVVTVLGFMVGIFLLILWSINFKSTSRLIKTIKSRLPPEGVQEEDIPNHK